MKSWLSPLQAALDCEDAPLAFFVRDDDAGRANGKLDALLDLFQSQDAPIDVAAIPAQLTPAYAAALVRRRENMPFLRLHQHGYAHISHESVGRKCEFGPSRGALRQQGDIRQGKDRLLALLGDTDPIFTPPWNRCTQDTVSALTREHFRIISREANAAPLAMGMLHHLPVNIDWRKRRKDIRETPHDAAAAMAARVRSGASAIGLMLHHEVLEESDLQAIEQLITLVRDHKRISHLNMMALSETKHVSLLVV